MEDNTLVPVNQNIPYLDPASPSTTMEKERQTITWLFQHCSIHPVSVFQQQTLENHKAVVDSQHQCCVLSFPITGTIVRNVSGRAEGGTNIINVNLRANNGLEDNVPLCTYRD